MARVIRVRYEKGVLKPLEELDLEEGEELDIVIRRRGSIREVLDKYTGIFGKARFEELQELEEEAQFQ